jgi:hypothetical protein
MNDLAAPPSLFVVACPACGGWSAATAAMVGESACCPQCAAAFRVPQPAVAPSQSPPVTTASTSVVPDVVAPAVAASPRNDPRAVPEPSVVPTALPTTPVVAQPVPVEPAPAAAPLSTFEIPDHVLTPPAPDAEMQFREPVKTVGHGPNTIELRRLTPEEKDARRRRRNIIMLLTGAAILIAIAVVLGSGRRR